MKHKINLHAWLMSLYQNTGIPGIYPPVSGSLPTLPDSIFPTLPAFLQKVLAMAANNEERDVMLLGSLVSLGACLPKYHGFYDGLKMYPHLYLFITGRASAGKGRLSLCKQLVMPVDKTLECEGARLKEKYEADLKAYNKKRGKNAGMKKPLPPPELMLIIPANSSATGVFQLLAENEGRGLIFETEGDTLAQAFKADSGQFSHGMRKAAHHETISYYRRTEREFVKIPEPCLAAVLAGTPGQVASLIPNAENGLFSRFVFYHMNMRLSWKNVFAPKGHKNLAAQFKTLGEEFLPLYKALNQHPEIEFSFTPEQQDEFNDFFIQIEETYLTLQGADYTATIRRLGLIAFRLAMTLSALRILETGDFSPEQFCLEVDFQAALSMVRVLVKHSGHVFSKLTKETKMANPKDTMQQLLDQLPVQFNRAELLELAKSLSIAERTAYKYVTNWCNKGLISRGLHGIYTKTDAGLP
jgi:hypothetical protein